MHTQKLSRKSIKSYKTFKFSTYMNFFASFFLLIPQILADRFCLISADQRNLRDTSFIFQNIKDTFGKK